jgi:hypothetical protein
MMQKVTFARFFVSGLLGEIVTFIPNFASDTLVQTCSLIAPNEFLTTCKAKNRVSLT